MNNLNGKCINLPCLTTSGLLIMYLLAGCKGVASHI